ncbi:MAG: hypothetical protein FWE63_04105 [Bacteroidales bacterium]|nr:hypothetical protein [Bacteroidales bacterium]
MVTKNRYNNPVTVLLIFAVFCTCCADKLRLAKTPFTGNQLRIDGYYYHQYTGADGVEYMSVLFLYENGILHYGGAFPKNKLSEIEQNYSTEEWINIVRKLKYYWGVFLVTGNTIKYKRWYPSEPPLRASIREGVILNDTTFRITKVYDSDLRREDRLYRFKAFSPKPDSTNNFVK